MRRELGTRRLQPHTQITLRLLIIAIIARLSIGVNTNSSRCDNCVLRLYYYEQYFDNNCNGYYVFIVHRVLWYNAFEIIDVSS